MTDTAEARPLKAIAATLVASASLATAWGFQILGGYLPCHLCLVQRNPYYIGIPLLLVALAAGAAGRRKAFVILCALASATFLVGAAIGVYHAGAEWRFWEGPSSCGVTAGTDMSAGDLLAQLQATKVVSCTEASFRFLGLSFAGWNVVASLIVAGLACSAARASAGKRAKLTR
jgi:disulfide bond formation protein DsbB